MSSAMTFSNVSKEKTGIYFDLRKKDDKLSVIIKEVVEGVNQPVRFGFCDVIGQGDKAFMTIRAPLRQVGEDGEFLTQPQKRNDEFIGNDGKPVETEGEAAREYVYMKRRDDESKVVYGTIANVNVKNDKVDGTPTAFTMLTLKLFTDAEALDAARMYAKLQIVEEKAGKDSEEYTRVKEQMREQGKASGTYNNYFIRSGHDFLREIGFDVREQPAREAPSTPAP